MYLPCAISSNKIVIVLVKMFNFESFIHEWVIHLDYLPSSVLLQISYSLFQLPLSLPYSLLNSRPFLFLWLLLHIYIFMSMYNLLSLFILSYMYHVLMANYMGFDDITKVLSLGKFFCFVCLHLGSRPCNIFLIHTVMSIGIGLSCLGNHIAEASWVPFLFNTISQ